MARARDGTQAPRCSGRGEDAIVLGLGTLALRVFSPCLPSWPDQGSSSPKLLRYPFQICRIVLPALEINLRRLRDTLARRLVDVAQLARRCADEKRIVRHRLVFADERAGADDAIGADPGAVHDDRAHADQGVVADGATVQDRIVADGAVFTDRQRIPGIGVQRGIILDIAAHPDLDPLVVAAQHGIEPDAGAALEPYLADDDCIFGHVAQARRRLRRLPGQTEESHATLRSARAACAAAFEKTAAALYPLSGLST